MLRHENDQPQIATLRDRSAAQILDLTICGLLFWYVGMALARRVRWHRSFHGRPGSTRNAGNAGRIGLCGKDVPLLLRHRERLQRYTGKGYVRAAHLDGWVPALCRPFRPSAKYPSPSGRDHRFLIAGSSGRRTLGDRVAGTCVVRLAGGLGSQTEPPPHEQRANWEARTKATLIDLALLALFVIAYLFATRSIAIEGRVGVNLRGISLLVLIHLLFFYFVALDGILGGTVGKVVARLRVVRADGAPCGFAARPSVPHAGRSIFGPPGSCHFCSFASPLPGSI